MTAWLTEVCPDRITPSTGIVSPGRTRRISPICTSFAAITVSELPDTFLAVRGVRCTSFSIPALAFATVRSSRRAPSCMIKATSPAAKISPIMTEAISAMETSTSAFISNAVTSPITASRIMGIPHRMIAAHAGSIPAGRMCIRLAASAMPEITRNVISLFIPPHSSIFSNVFTKTPPLPSHTPMGISPLYL